MDIPILKTDRLILRPLTVDDADSVYAWVSDEKVTKYMPYQTYTNVDQVKEWLMTIQSEQETYNFGFALRESNLLIGSGCIGYNKEKNYWDFGYNIRHDYWNKGYATEATKGMMKFVYNNFGARDFSSNHATDNPSSGKVIEKCGLSFHHFGEYSKFDGSEIFKAKFYTTHLDVIA